MTEDSQLPSPYRGVVKTKDISGRLPRHASKKHKLRELSSIKRIVVHTTDWDITPWRLAEYDVGPNHISKTGCPGITYHELIYPDGASFKTLPYEEEAWHVGMWNPGSLGIALVYRVKDNPTNKAMRALYVRCGTLCLRLGLSPDSVVGHRELKGTGWFWFKGSKKLRKTCPGMQVNLDILRVHVAKYMQLVLKGKGLYRATIDGLWGPRSKAALKAYNA
jgi:hypothetical protein